MLKVFGMAVSGNCHKVRMVLEHLEQPYEWQEISIMGGETQTAEFLARNPIGKVPAVQLDDGRALWESGAIIQYLANGSNLWPTEKFTQAEVLKWMFFEQNIHEVAIAEARFITRFLAADHPRQAELPVKYEKGNKVLAVMDQHLSKNRFFVADRCTIADIALFGYTHVADQGGFELARYPAIGEWLIRMLKIPGFTRMTG